MHSSYVSYALMHETIHGVPCVSQKKRAGNLNFFEQYAASHRPAARTRHAASCVPPWAVEPEVWKKITASSGCKMWTTCIRDPGNFGLEGYAPRREGAGHSVRVPGSQLSKPCMVVRSVVFQLQAACSCSRPKTIQSHDNDRMHVHDARDDCTYVTHLSSSSSHRVKPISPSRMQFLIRAPSLAWPINSTILVFRTPAYLS